MEKITITRIGPEKVIEYTNKKTGKPDSFKKVGVLTNEYGERWMDIAFRGEVPVKVGQSYEVEITEREYTNRAGEVKKAYEAKLPRENRGGGGMSNEQFVQLNRTLNAILAEVKMVRGMVDTTTSAGTKVPDFSQTPRPEDITFDGPEFTEEDFPEGYGQ